MNDRYYKQGQHLLEWENEDLNLRELNLKLEAAIEGHEDDELVELIEGEIRERFGVCPACLEQLIPVYEAVDTEGKHKEIVGYRICDCQKEDYATV